MPFTPKNWQDDPSTATPITAAALEDLEGRLAAYTDSIAGLGDEQIRDVIGAALIAGVGGVITLDDAGNTITIAPDPTEPPAPLTTVTSTTTVPNPSTTGQTWIPYTVSMNVTFVFPAALRGRSFTLELRQDATGSRVYTWPGTVKWPAGVAPTPSGANKIDLISFSSDGTSWFGVSAMNY